MSEHPEAPHGRDRPDDGHERPHGRVEELREDLQEAVEEVVEHVPKPVRWTVGKIAWVVGLSFLGLVVLVLVTALLYLANRTDWVAKELTLFVNQTLALRSDLAVNVRDIKGNPFTGVRLIEPRVRFRGGGPTLVAAPSMKLSYSLWGFVTGGARTIEIDLDRPVITVPSKPDGSLRLPRWRSSGSPGKPGRGLGFRVRIAHGAVDLPGEDRDVQGLALDASVGVGLGPTRVDVRRLSWRDGPWDSRLLRFSGDLVSGDSTRFTVRELRTPDLVLRGGGEWERGRPGRRLSVDVERVRWKWLAKVFDNDAFDVGGEGRMRIEAEGDRDWDGSFDLDATWDDLPLAGTGRFRWASGALRVDPLRVRSPAGQLAGSYHFAPHGWDVGGDVRHGDPSRWGPIHLENWPAGDLNGSFRFAMDKHGPTHSRLTAVLASSEIGGWKADSAHVWLDQPPDRPDTFTVDLVRGAGRASLRGVSLPDGWHGDWEVANYRLEEWPDGRASGLQGALTRGHGKVEGRDQGLFVSGALEGGAAEWLGTRFGAWRLPAIGGRLLPTPDLSLRARLADVTFLGVHFDSAASTVRLGDAEARFHGLRAVAGDTVVTAAGLGAWADSRWSVTLDTLTARSEQFAWVADPPARFSGDPKGTTFDRLVARDGAARLEVRGRWAAAGGSYDWSAIGQGLDLGRLGLPAEWGLSGRADARLDVNGPSGDPAWEFTGAASRPGAKGHVADSLRISLAGRPSRLDLRELEWRMGEGRVSASGLADGTARAWPDTLTADGVLRWIADAGTWSGRVVASRFPIAGVAGFVPEAGGWRGTLDGTLVFGGRPGAPDLDLRARGTPLGWKDEILDVVDVRARYRTGRLEVPELRVTRAGVVSTASGVMPLELALGRPPRAPDLPMHWTVDVPNGDLSVVPLFVPQIGAASGRFQMRATLAGTPVKPDLDGFVHVRGATLRLAAREEVLQDLYADLSFDESRVTLDTLGARQDRRGLVVAKGVVSLDGLRLKGYRFNLRMRDFTALESGLYNALFDGDFVVTDGPKVNGQTIPQVTGTVELQRGTVFYDFANVSESEQLAATTQPLFWTYRLQVHANSNLHWSPPAGDIEFSADLQVEQTADSLQIYGEMNALRGTYWFLSNRFDVTTADLTFDNVGGVNPVLDVVATTRILGSAPAYQGPLDNTQTAAEEPHEVTVTIQGRAAEPRISFSSSPSDWDEPTILRQLTLGRFDPNNPTTLSDPLDNYLTRSLNRQLSAEMARAFRGYLNEWSLEREHGGLLSGEGDVIFGVGTPITRDITLRYRQRVPGLGRTVPARDLTENPLERDVAAEYRINRFFYLTTELTQRRPLPGVSTSSVSGTTDFNVNLKARWEY